MKRREFITLLGGAAASSAAEGSAQFTMSFLDGRLSDADREHVHCHVSKGHDQHAPCSGTHSGLHCRVHPFAGTERRDG